MSTKSGAIQYELVRADKVLEEAYNAVRAKIEGAITDVPLYEAIF
ncbi:hypothetical protein [Pseudomonas cremoris]|nr:hypothetical protein [Pseudomonas cremoris]